MSVSNPTPSSGRDGGAEAPPIGGALGRVVSAVYQRVVSARNRRFDAGHGVVTLHVPVVSVGNLSVGGTGKTPMVLHLVRLLLAAGKRPCIAMRGYKSVQTRDGLISDEAEEFRRLLGGAGDGGEAWEVPIVAQPDRAAGLAALFKTPAGKRVDCVVLDDGFQHRRIARDLDIVLIDASRDPFADRELPAGWLREPVSSLERAGAVVVTHAEQVSERTLEMLEARIARFHGWPAVAITRHAWTRLGVLVEGRESVEPVTWLSGKRCVGVCAIGNPKAFVAEAERAAGGKLLGEIVLRDHDPFAPRTVTEIIKLCVEQKAEALVTTEKDWSKLSRVPATDWPCPVVRPHLSLEFDRGKLAFESLVLTTIDRTP